MENVGYIVLGVFVVALCIYYFVFESKNSNSKDHLFHEKYWDEYDDYVDYLTADDARELSEDYSMENKRNIDFINDKIKYIAEKEHKTEYICNERVRKEVIDHFKKNKFIVEFNKDEDGYLINRIMWG